MTDELKDIPQPAVPQAILGPDQALLGPHIPPQQQIVLYSDEQWEAFVQEWAHFCLKRKYVQVQKFSGPGDKGIDVAGFMDADKLNGVWDNYQCKHYNNALHPTDAWPEIAKLLWFTFKKEFKAPRKYFFVAPRGAGTTLGKLLSNAPQLKARLIQEWDKHCKSKITGTEEVSLEGNFLAYVRAFDYTIFGAKTALELIEDHKLTPYHAARFGGGLPDRPAPHPPPGEIASKESRYIDQLLAAYSDHTKCEVLNAAILKSWPRLKDHFLRQRVAFYHAESLRVFARDTVPAGTFESFQEDIYTGIIDTHDAPHSDGYVRVCEVTKAARELQITSNVLITRAKPQDRDGVCHQLANEDRLQWLKS
jgi:hypothetical protein